jgi:hypothetical protein
MQRRRIPNILDLGMQPATTSQPKKIAFKIDDPSLIELVKHALDSSRLSNSTARALVFQAIMLSLAP